MPKPIGFVLNGRYRRQTLQALAIGRVSGRRAAEQGLADARAEVVKLKARLQRAEDRLQLARSIIARGEAIKALQTRDPLTSIH
jgi:hypothetical protein